MVRLLRGFAVTLVAVTVAYAAAAQNAQPQRLRGSVMVIDGKEMTVSIGDGAVAKIRLADDWSVIEASRLDPAKIPAGAFVGAGATKLPNGTLRAVQVTVFPQQSRGTNEGQRAWNGAPEGLMTNAPVTAIVTSAQGPELTLTGGQNYKVVVPPDAFVVLQEIGTRDMIKTGANISFAPARAADGAMTATRIVVGKDGAVPPI